MDRPRRRLLSSIAGVAVAVAAILGMPHTDAAFSDVTASTGNGFASGGSFGGVTLYLQNNPSPPVGDTTAQKPLPLGATTPTATTLYNYDVGRDAFPGLLLAQGVGLDDPDSSKHQRWHHAVGSPLSLSGTATVTLWTAAQEFKPGQPAGVMAGLYDCDSGGTSCSALATNGLKLDPWPASWQELSLDLGAVNHTISAGRILAVRVAVIDSTSTVDVMFAYDTTAYPSRLTVS
jgi:hypothetical protein